MRHMIFFEAAGLEASKSEGGVIAQGKGRMFWVFHTRFLIPHQVGNASLEKQKKICVTVINVTGKNLTP